MICSLLWLSFHVYGLHHDVSTASTELQPVDSQRSHYSVRGPVNLWIPLALDYVEAVQAQRQWSTTGTVVMCPCWRAAPFFTPYSVLQLAQSLSLVLVGVFWPITHYKQQLQYSDGDSIKQWWVQETRTNERRSFQRKLCTQHPDSYPVGLRLVSSASLRVKAHSAQGH